MTYDDQRRRRDDGDHLVEQVRAVFLEDRPVPGGPVGEQDQFVPPLAQREKQRQQDRQDQQPVADRDVDRDRAGDRAQHEPDRDRQHVDDDDVLERPGIECEQRRRSSARRVRTPGAETMMRRARPTVSTSAVPIAVVGEIAPDGNRTEALARMQTILLAIGNVVDEVDDAGEDAEDGEGGERLRRWPPEPETPAPRPAARTAARQTRSGSWSTATAAETRRGSAPRSARWPPRS